MRRTKKKKSYWDKLQDRRWQKKRTEIMQRDNFCCQYPNCPSTTSMLDVHHKAYLRNTDPWDYPEYCLITLCREHHEVEQNRMERAHMAITSNPQLIEYCITNAIENPNRIPRNHPVSALIETVSDPSKVQAEEGKRLFALMRKNIQEGV